MFTRKQRIFSCDFETTVYEGQERTDVWAAACVELGHEDVKIFGSIAEQFQFFQSLKSNVIAYYHNLKFDGAFWLNYLLVDLKYKQSLEYEENDGDLDIIRFQEMKHMENRSVMYCISDMGQWYFIRIKVNGYIIELRDSLKLLPFSVATIGKAFHTKKQKLEMDYKGERYPGCYISPEEQEYIKNDVLVVKEALEKMRSEGHDHLTIGSCCLTEFKMTVDKQDYANWFPNLVERELDKDVHKYPNVDKWVRKSYKGGWCYLAKGKENHVYHNGTTADVNSLYPSMMHSVSGNYFPVGLPHFWTGEIPPQATVTKDRYFFVRIKCNFKLRDGYLPFIQIKGSHLYKGNECLESNEIVVDGKKYNKWKDELGRVHDCKVELTLTQTDYYLFLEHYEVTDIEYIDGCWFYAMQGIFDDYINHYAEMKMREKGAKRTIAKLFLNNLYGKMASSTTSSFKVAYENESGYLSWQTVVAEDKTPGYIPVGSAITSYARNFTIRAAQKNYHGVDKPGFIYADTDSIHCDLPPEDVVGIEVDDVKFCCWKLESIWDDAIFVRQKTYIEHEVGEGVKGKIEPKEPNYLIKCAGMPKTCKDLFGCGLTGKEPPEDMLKKLDEHCKDFIYDEDGRLKRRSLKEFKAGLNVPGKLMPKQIPGGVILVDTTFEMK